MKVNELHQIEDINYKQISTVFRSIQFWIDPRNLSCVCFLNKSRLWHKISFKNQNKKFELLSLEQTYFAKQQKI